MRVITAARAPVARGGDGDVGRAAAEELAEGLDLAQRDAGLQRVHVHADPAHRDDVEAHLTTPHARAASRGCEPARPAASPNASPSVEHAVLLDDDPAVVAAPRRARAQKRVEVHVAVAEGAEQAAPPGGQRVGALGLDAREHVEPDVLDVDRADPLAPVGERLDRVAAGDRDVPAVEQQRDVGVLEQALDLGDALDVGRRVVVEDRLEAALAGRVGGARDALDERAPARVVQAQRGVLAAAARVGDPLGAARVAQHGPRAGRAGRREQVERVVQAREALLPALALGEARSARSRRPPRARARRGGARAPRPRRGSPGGPRSVPA